jgi:hypothetical protein
MPSHLFADFETAGGTVATTVRRGVSVGSESPLLAWLRSEDARQHEGRWVLLNSSLAAVDDDLSPSALRDRHPGEDIVFVPPASVHIGA